jgi:hypothetical protein
MSCHYLSKFLYYGLRLSPSQPEGVGQGRFGKIVIPGSPPNLSLESGGNIYTNVY